MRDAGSGFAQATLHHRGLTLLGAVAVAASLLLVPTPAQAAQHIVVSGEYGKEGPKSTGLGSGCRLAYQEATHRLYLLSDSKIYGLSVAPGSATPLGGGFPVNAGINSSCGDPDLEVDNSGGASKGNIYAIPSNPATIYGWSPAGASLSSPFPLNLGSGEACGLDVDNSGNIYVGYWSESQVRKYSPSGTLLATVNVGFRVCKVAVDRTNGDLYVQPYSGGNVKKYTAASGYATSSEIPTESSGNAGLAVNGSQSTLYVGGGTTVKAFDTTNASLVETITLSASGGQGIAVDEGTDTLFVTIGTGASGYIAEYLGVETPKATTGEPTANTEVSGTADPNGQGPITECYFEYGETTAYGSTQNCSESLPINSVEEVHAVLPGLLGEKTYHYRLVVGNGEPFIVGRGADKTITPHYVKGLYTEPATEVTRTKANLHATFEGDGQQTKYYFEWGETTAYGQTSSPPPGVSAGSPTYPPRTELSFNATGLTPETLYHYRVVAENPEGISPGQDRTFETLPAVGDVTTLPPTDLSPESITLNGEFTGNGEDTHFYFEFGLTPEYGEILPVPPPGKDAGSPVGPAPVSVKITDYLAYTPYHYRLVASNDVGTTVGQDETVMTPPALPPGISGTTASNVGATEATLEAEVVPNRWFTSYRFEYGTDTNYESHTLFSESIGDDVTSHLVRATVADLKPGTAYHFRVRAVNFTGTADGPDRTFTTDGPPRVDSSSASALGREAAHFVAQVTANGAPTSVHFDYGTSIEYGQVTPSVDIGEGQTSSPASFDLGGLTVGTTYHARAVASSPLGSVTGPDLSFTTESAPAEPPAPPPVVKCKRGFVKKHRKCVRKKNRHRKRHHRHHKKTGAAA